MRLPRGLVKCSYWLLITFYTGLASGQSNDFILPPGPTTSTLAPPKICEETPKEKTLFTSDNFPAHYNKDTKCNYTMEAAGGGRVLLTFHLLNTESNPRCRYDVVSIFDSNGTALNRFCGESNKNIQVLSSGSSLRMNFKTDSVQESSGFLASWQEVPSDYQVDEEVEGSYLVSFPGTFLEQEQEQVCVELFKPEEETTIEVQLFVNNKSPNWLSVPLLTQTEEVIKLDNNRCFTLNLPAIKEDKALLNIQIKTGDKVISSFKEVKVLRSEVYTLVQTDKGQYKAGDLVMFRVMLVDHNLKPEAVEVEEMWVEDPRGRRLAQWTDQKLEHGMVQQQMRLSKEPELGTWTIKIKSGEVDEQAKFLVSEYVLPKFEVKLKSPPAVLKNAEKADWEVCGVFTHGGSVKGVVKANFSSKYQQRTWRPPPPIIKSIVMEVEVGSGQDCAVLTLNSEQIKNITEKVEDFQLEVEFVEAGTSTIEKAEWKGRLVDKALLLDIGTSSNQFILGGFPYTGQFRVTGHDKSPRVSEELEVCVHLYRDIAEVRNLFNRRGIWSMTEEEMVEAGRQMVNLEYSKQCHNVTTDLAGEVNFKVPLDNIPEDVKKLTMKAVATNHLEDKISGMKQPEQVLEVVLTHTDADLSMSLQEKEREQVKCGDQLTAELFFSSSKTRKVDLHYQALAKGNIIWSSSYEVDIGSVDARAELVKGAMQLSAGNTNQEEAGDKTARHVMVQEVVLDIDHHVSPSLQLVVYVNDGNKTLMDSHTYKVEACQEHSVTTAWSQTKVYPGSKVDMTVEAGSGSLCALSATDKAVDLLGNKNKVGRERLGELQVQIGRRKEGHSNLWQLQRKCPEAYETIKVFETTGIQIITDLPFMADCQTIIDSLNSGSLEPEPELGYAEYDLAYDMAPSSIAASYDAAPMVGPAGVGPPPSPRRKVASQRVAAMKGPEKPKVALRQFFPETWLFDFSKVSRSDGRLVRSLSAPHTITTWSAEAVCMSSNVGLGAALPASLLVSQDFFAELRLPAFVKRDESFPLNVSLFNYLDDVELPLVVELVSEGEGVVAEESVYEVCVKPNDNEVISIKTTAIELGKVNVTVKATVSNQVKGCTPVTQGEGFADALVKPLTVKPEGFPVEKVESDFKCIEKGEEETFKMSKLELPEDNLVEGSERAWVEVTGDIMAPALENVGSLVRLPTGCGEQNMVGLVPNIYLLEYLSSTGQKQPELENKAKEFMEVGYNRQQKYHHANGAYSIWGDKGEKDGSSWLTAFVVKSFSEASQHIEVSNSLVQGSVDWLINSQLENGCFRKRGYVHSSYLKGGGSDSSLTPFIVTALVEAKTRLDVKVPMRRLADGVECMLKEYNSSDLYSTIVTAHATTVLLQKLENVNPKQEEEFTELQKQAATWKSKVDGIIEDLEGQANTTLPGDKFWDTARERSKWGYYSSSKAVEMTAYMVLVRSLREELGLAVDSVKWLAKQRNSQGGFVSTQDTVVGLQAISTYAQKANRIPLALSVELTETNKGTSNKLRTFSLQPSNGLLLQTEYLTLLPSSLELATQGSGCALVQTVLRYNTNTTPRDNGFTLKASRVVGKEPRLQVCSEYKGGRQETGMVVMEVELVSGWDVVRPEDLINEVDSGVERVEREEDKVVLYFDQMELGRKNCLELELVQVTKVENSKPALVTVYDYYTREETASTMYEL